MESFTEFLLSARPSQRSVASATTSGRRPECFAMAAKHALLPRRWTEGLVCLLAWRPGAWMRLGKSALHELGLPLLVRQSSRARGTAAPAPGATRKGLPQSALPPPWIVVASTIADSTAALLYPFRRRSYLQAQEATGTSDCTSKKAASSLLSLPSLLASLIVMVICVVVLVGTATSDRNTLSVVLPERLFGDRAMSGDRRSLGPRLAQPP